MVLPGFRCFAAFALVAASVAAQSATVNLVVNDSTGRVAGDPCAAFSCRPDTATARIGPLPRHHGQTVVSTRRRFDHPYRRIRSRRRAVASLQTTADADLVATRTASATT